MLILASGSKKHIEKYGTHAVGGLLVPSNGELATKYSDLGASWAMDNGCFHGLDKPAYIKMLKSNAGTPGCLWCVVPDVVCDAEATLKRFRMWQPVVKYFGYPIAFVAQNGAENMPLPWNDFDCLFLGGDTDWKIGHAAFTLVEEARSQGKWVHMGRVNSRRRIRIAGEFGCNSVDGKAFSLYGDRDLKWATPMAVFYGLANAS